MKTKKIIIYFLLMLPLYSCWYTNQPTITYTLVNDTDFDVSLVGYRNRGTSVSDSIFLSPNSRLEFERQMGEDSDSRSFFSIASVDSVRIVFDSKKLLVLTDSAHALLLEERIVKITQEDYNNAVPIEN
ncbi:hypothetical protein [Maribellus sediminis]|uniref:hypothetical protein n=1 Tax=Maribellus sediminis TaxID=2696285 RepID=UPI0014304B28|nr:hypothetical protein [Maribellus sediminis]